MAGQQSTKCKLFRRAGTNPSYSYTAVVGLFAVAINRGEVGAVDISDLDSLAEETSPTFKTGAELTGTINYKSGVVTQQTIETAFEDQEEGITYRFFIPTIPLVTSGSQTGTAYDCTGFWSKLDGPKASTGDKVTMDFTFKPSTIARVTSASYTVV